MSREVYQLLLANRDGTVVRLAKTTGFPNGLAVHPDGSHIVGLAVEHRLLGDLRLGDRVGSPQPGASSTMRSDLTAWPSTKDGSMSPGATAKSST